MPRRPGTRLHPRPPPGTSGMVQLRCGSLEQYDAADAVLALHQLEAAVDLVERQRVRDERFDVDVAGEPALDELRDAVAALDAAEGRAGDAASGDQVARHDVQRLALPRDADHRREAPAHACGLDRLPHYLDVAGGLEGVVGAEASGHLDDVLHRVGAADESVGRALPAREVEPLLREVDADDALGALKAAAGDGAEADHPGA